MPYEGDYVSPERLKALTEAASRASDLHRDLVASKVIAPEVIERFRELILLLNRAAADEPQSPGEVSEFEKILGADTGEERQ